MPPLCHAAAAVTVAMVLLVCPRSGDSFAPQPRLSLSALNAPSASAAPELRMSTYLMASSPSETTGEKPTLSRSERKALDRAKRNRKKVRDDKMKARSDHPEAVVKHEKLVTKLKTTASSSYAPVAPMGPGTAHHPAREGSLHYNSRRRHNYADREDALDDEDDATNEREFPLNSNAVDVLGESSTADDVVKAIKRAQNLHDVHDIRSIERFLIEEVDETFAYGYRGSLLSRLAVAALHMNQPELAHTALEVRRKDHFDSMLPLESAAVVRGLLRVHDVDRAWVVLQEELGLPLPSEDDDDNDDNDDVTDWTSSSVKDLIVYRARSLGSIATRHFFEGEPKEGLAACRALAEMGDAVTKSELTAEEVGMPWERIIRGAAQCESRRREGTPDWGRKKKRRDRENAKASGDFVANDESEGDDSDHGDADGWPCNFVYAVLDAMMLFPSENSDQTFEALSNALVRRTVFVTGAVDLEGCPEEDRGEVAFIGRSNVGKSSLVNMLTNRKSLAYTSKTPGKTQQFNFFAVNDKPEREREIRYGDDVRGEKDRDAFYIADLPGFGFAKVPQQQRQMWAEFMEDYLANRSALRVVFHLIDARHGPTDEDVKIMQKVGDILPKKEGRVQYVVVLTKADKNVKGAATSRKNPGRVPKKIREKLEDAMNANRVGYAPVVLTSAETRLGRDEVWKYLRLAAEM